MTPRRTIRTANMQSPVIPIIGEMVRANPGAISLGQGVVHYGPPPQAMERLAHYASEADNHKYKSVQGIPPLLEALTDKLQRENGIAVDEETSVVVTAGGNMAFVAAILAITDPGDEIILQSPYYFNHDMAVFMADCRPVIAPTDTAYQLQPDMIAAAISSRTRAVVTISPNNPTGAVYEEAALRAVNALCRERGIYHIHDEAYEYFTYGDARHFSPGSTSGSGSYTISLFSLSKSYGMASWRIGYMSIPSDLLVIIKKILDTMLICPPVISQYAAVGALEAGQAYARVSIRSIAEVREMAEAALATLGDRCEVQRADGAFYYLIKVHTEIEPMALVEQLIREHGVAVLPGTTFGVNDCCTLRIAYGALQKETAEEGIGRLVDGLRSLSY